VTSESSCQASRHRCQRILNYTVAGFVLLVLLMPFGIIAMLIKFDSPGPIFFRQPRIGFRNQVFYIWKFRTMYADRSDVAGVRLTERNDPRVNPDWGMASRMVAR
jgi:polysaccharide biosynthesis protein PslA